MCIYVIDVIIIDGIDSEKINNYRNVICIYIYILWPRNIYTYTAHTHTQARNIYRYIENGIFFIITVSIK